MTRTDRVHCENYAMMGYSSFGHYWRYVQQDLPSVTRKEALEIYLKRDTPLKERHYLLKGV